MLSYIDWHSNFLKLNSIAMSRIFRRFFALSLAGVCLHTCVSTVTRQKIPFSISLVFQEISLAFNKHGRAVVIAFYESAAPQMIANCDTNCFSSSKLSVIELTFVCSVKNTSKDVLLHIKHGAKRCFK